MGWMPELTGAVQLRIAVVPFTRTFMFNGGDGNGETVVEVATTVVVGAAVVVVVSTACAVAEVPATAATATRAPMDRRRVMRGFFMRCTVNTHPMWFTGTDVIRSRTNVLLARSEGLEPPTF